MKATTLEQANKQKTELITRAFVKAALEAYNNSVDEAIGGNARRCVSISVRDKNIADSNPLCRVTPHDKFHDHLAIAHFGDDDIYESCAILLADGRVKILRTHNELREHKISILYSLRYSYFQKAGCFLSRPQQSA